MTVNSSRLICTGDIDDEDDEDLEEGDRIKLIEQPAKGKNKPSITVTKFQNTKSDKSAKPTNTPPTTRAASTKPSTPAKPTPAPAPSRPAAKPVGAWSC